MDRRETTEFALDRRAVPRGGRRNGDQKKPWYLRRPFLLTTASLVFVGWRRLRTLRKRSNA